MEGDRNLTDRQRAIRANKRGRGSTSNVASSSSRQPRAPQPVIRFPEDVDAKYQPKVNINLLRSKRVIPHRTLDFDVLGVLGFRDQIEELLTADWKRLFAIRTPVYRHLCEEFFSTFRMDPTQNRVGLSSMTFQLGGTTQTLSFAEFGVHMGLYTQEEVQQEDFTEGLSSWPVGMNAATFWRKHNLGPDDYNHNTKQASMTNPLYRILLRGIAESISNRGNCPNNATGQDLFYLYCIIERRPCNLAKCLAFYLYDRGHGKDRGAVAGGSFVCHLALRMGLTTEEQLSRGVGPIARVGLIDIVALRNMGILDRKSDLAERYRDDSDEEDDDDDGQAQGDGRAPVQGAVAGGDSGHFPPDLLGRFAALEMGIQQVRDDQHDYYLQSLHQQRYQSEAQYEYFTHHQMPMHVPPHMFMPPETEPYQGPQPAFGGHHSVFPPRMDVPPPPPSDGYMSYPTEHGAPSFTYPQFGTYQREQQYYPYQDDDDTYTGYGAGQFPQFGSYQGGEPSVFSHPDDMDDE